MDGPSQPPKGQIHQVSIKNELYSGPVPSPEFMEKFKQVQPDFPERIMKLTENEDARRTEIVAIEKFRIAEEFKAERRGQMLTFVCLVAFLVVTVIFVMLGQSVPAIFSSIVPILWALKNMFSSRDRSPAKKKQNDAN